MNLTVPLKHLFGALIILTLVGVGKAEETEARRLLSELILDQSSQEVDRVTPLYDHGDTIIKDTIAGWRIGEVFTLKQGDTEVALLKRGESFEDILSGSIQQATGDETINRASRKLRKRLRRVVDFLDLSSNDPQERIDSVLKLAKTQKIDLIEVIEERVDRQKDPEVLAAFHEALNILHLKHGTREQQLKAVADLGEQRSFGARDFIENLRLETEDEAIQAAAVSALKKIDSAQKWRDFYGSLVHGLSTGSVLLLVSYGLAITFGLMGVINMAHGEFIAIGGYTVFVIQGLFADLYGVGSTAYEWYFVVALPCAFLTSAFCGVLLERSVIQFLYRRPLESLLATWGVSMIIQQLIRLKFGAANVSVSSPEWLSGSFQAAGLSMSYNRLSLIAFALLVIVATWILLNKTNWGLHVRATMQNRLMASSLGINSTRVNMMTFAYGSGLAGLAGAFLSQIGNVGPSMGQTYIVDSFMVVVVGGVGNLLGAALSSMGIGMTEQILQPFLGPVMGKITVLLAIILFLQFKPGGLFPSRSRSLDD
ncbi:MAG: urea ABC transporter permease subunit UrtB [Verrucomicrobiaceae bacterium]